MARLVRNGILIVVTAAWALSGNFLAAAPAWESGGRPYEVSDLQSVVVAPRPTVADGQPPLPPEPGSAEEIGMPAPVDVPDGVVIEDAEVPSLTDRMQEFIPSVPDMLTFDSAAAIEPDGTVVPCSTKQSVWDCLDCVGDACWTVRFEGLALWRNAPANRPLFTTLTTDLNGNPIAENVLKPYPKNSVGLKVPKLQIVSVSKLTSSSSSLPETSRKTSQSTFKIDVQTDSVALYVWLEAMGKAVIIQIFFNS